MKRRHYSETGSSRAGRRGPLSLSRASLLGGTAIMCLAAGPVAATVDSWDISGPVSITEATTELRSINVGAGAENSGTLTIEDGAQLTLDTQYQSGASGIELGNNGTGTLNVAGGTLSVEVKGNDGVAAGRIWVGGGASATSGTGTITMTNGKIEFVGDVGSITDYAGLAIGRGPGAGGATGQVTGTFNQNGGQVVFETMGALDLGTQGGKGTYSLSGNAVMDASQGGLTMYIGSRVDSVTGQAANGTLAIHDNAQFTFHRDDLSPNSGGQLYVGDAGSTGAIVQDGAGSIVTIGVQNPIRFGANLSSDTIHGGGTGRYDLSAGTLHIQNTGGSAQIIFGDAAGGTGTFAISGGTATVDTSLILGSSAASGDLAAAKGTIDQTGGTLAIGSSGALYLTGGGAGAYNLTGGALEIGSTALHGHRSGTDGTYAFNLGSGTIKVTGSALAADVDATLANGTTATIDTNGLGATWSGVLSGGGGLSVTGGSTLTLAAPNSYTGGTTIGTGTTLALASGGSIAVGSALNDNGIFDLSGASASLSLGALSGSGTIKTGLNTLTVGTDNSSSAFSGTVVNDGVTWADPYGTFVKDGTGTLNLSGATVSGGEFHVVHGKIAVTSGSSNVDYLALGTGADGNAGLDISGGTLTIGTALQVGDFSGAGFVNQTGGLVSIQQLCGLIEHCGSLNIGNQGGTGTYNLSGGTLSLTDTRTVIGRNSGTNPASSGTLNISGSGVVSIVRGSLIVGDNLAVGGGSAGSGTIHQTGGTFSVDAASQLYLSGSGHGTYELNGGTLAIGGSSLYGTYGPNPTDNYTFNLGNGTIKVTGSALVANVNATLASGTAATINTNGLGATWSGTLSGNGALRQTGGGTLTLAAANTYTGGTSVGTGSTLSLLTDQSAGTGRILLNDGSTLAFADGLHVANGLELNGAVFFNVASGEAWESGALSGHGSYSFTGSGILHLTGDNSGLNGTTTVSDGVTVDLSNPNSLGTSAVQVTGGGATFQYGNGVEITNAVQLASGAVLTTAVTSGTQATQSGTLSGDGGLTKTGDGTLVLNAANSFTGGTTLTAGTLVLGHGGALGSGALSMAEGTTLGYDGNFTVNNAITVNGDPTFDVTAGNVVTQAGVISDGATPGDIVKTGDGTLTLTANNSYTGGTTVSAGIMNIGDGGTSGAIVGNVIDNATLVFNRSDDTSFAGAITGSGALRKAGAGMLTLSGDSGAFAGQTDVAAGTLAVDGALGGTLTIDAGATLAGTGTVGSASLASGATLSPGGSGRIGTLNVSGDLSLAQGATYVVDADAAGASDLVHVTGATAIGGGTVASVAANGDWQASTRYKILTSDGGVSGTFDSVTSNMAFLTPQLSYDTDVVYLTLARNAVSFEDVAETPNQYATGAALSGLTGGALSDAVVQLDAPGARRAFETLSGEVHADVISLFQSESTELRSAVLNHSSVGGASGGTGLWAQGFGSWSDLDGDGNAASVSSSSGGVLVGIDHDIGSDWRLGIAGGWSRTSLQVADRASRGTSRNYHLAVYGGGRLGAFVLRGGAAYSWHDLSTTRDIGIGAFTDRLRADYDAHTRQAFGEIGYAVSVAKAEFQPYAGLAYVDVAANAFTETGGDAALHGRHESKAVPYSSLGTRLTVPFGLGDLHPTFRGKVEWQHAFGDKTPQRLLNFTAEGGSDTFGIIGTPIARDGALVEAGMDVNLAPNIVLGVSYAGRIANSAEDNQVHGSLAVRF